MRFRYSRDNLYAPQHMKSKLGADRGSRTPGKRLETSYDTTSPYPLVIRSKSHSSLSDSVFYLPMPLALMEYYSTGGGGGGNCPAKPKFFRVG